MPVLGPRLTTLLILFATAGATMAGTVGPEPFSVVITSPAADLPVFGEVRFAVEVAAAGPVARVDFYFQGTLVGTDETAPFSVTIDAGEDNIMKRFTAIAHGRDGGQGRATRLTPKVPIDLELDVTLQQLYVTVTRDDAAVLDLEERDFRVYDTGIEQQLVTFARGDVPISLVLLLDASASMKGEPLASAVGASGELLRRLDRLDQAMLLVFSDRVRHITHFTSGDQMRVTVSPVTAVGGTAINDHLYASLRLLDGQQGRPVVVLLSDGADTLSFLSIEQVVWKLRRSDALLYRIRSSRSVAEPLAFVTAWRGYQENRDEVTGLEEAIRESGGRIHSVPTGRLEEGIRGVLEELRQQYVLGYYPKLRTHDGSWRPVRVEVDAPDVTVRTRSGYIDQ